MRNYVIASAIVFDVIAAVQLIRVIMGWPISVAGFGVPVWASAIAFLLAGSLAAWAMLLIIKSPRPPAA